MRRILLGLGAAALLLSCGEPTTYGQAIQAQKRAMVKTPQDEAARPPPSMVVEERGTPSCPTLAREGSRDYARCEVFLENEQGVGGSGPASPKPQTDTKPEADPNPEYWRDSPEQR